MMVESVHPRKLGRRIIFGLAVLAVCVGGLLVAKFRFSRSNKWIDPEPLSGQEIAALRGFCGMQDFPPADRVRTAFLPDVGSILYMRIDADAAVRSALTGELWSNRAIAKDSENWALAGQSQNLEADARKADWLRVDASNPATQAFFWSIGEQSNELQFILWVVPAPNGKVALIVEVKGSNDRFPPEVQVLLKRHLIDEWRPFPSQFRGCYYRDSLTDEGRR
jgi:hypothetical protein